MDAAALACFHGLPGWRLLTSDDALEVAVLAMLTRRAEHHWLEHAKAQAVLIVDTYAKAQR